MATNPQPLTFSTSGVLTSPVNAVSSTSFTPQSAPITLAGSSTTTGFDHGDRAQYDRLVGGCDGDGARHSGRNDHCYRNASEPLSSCRQAATATNGGVTLTATNPAGAAPQTLSFNFGATSQFGSTFGVNSMTQDGYTSGHLTGFSTGSDGIVTGRYSNGQTRNLAQVVLANFTDKQGLQPLGDNQWAETSTSGAPLVGVPGSASLGLLQTSAVEDSNVDLTAELVNMITAQRAYQANAQTIKTQDQVLQTIVNLR